MDSQLHPILHLILSVFVFVGITLPIFYWSNTMNEEKKKRKFKFPLWAKTLIVLVLSVASVSIVAVVFSSNRIRSITRDHYVSKSIELADALGLYLNTDDVKSLKSQVETIYKATPEEERVNNTEWGTPEWETYLEKYNSVVESPEYSRIMDQIVEFHKVTNARFTYLAYADFDDKRLVYLVDDADVDERCLPGSFDEFTKQDYNILTDGWQNGFKPEITNTPEYGYLVSTGRPMTDENGDLVAFALVDLSMDKIVAEENRDATTLTLILLAIGFAVIIIGYLLVLFLIVRPIRILTTTANEYTSGGDDSLDKFAKVKINTKDEIEDLSNSMKKMEEDINHYIADLFSTTTKLEGAEKKADELKYIADRDALTGLMNKRSYFEKEERLNIDIKKGKAKFAVCMIDLNDLKKTNDTYGHEKGDVLIVAVSNIIKKVFALSSCYRVGGDEFVVIAENEDYKNIHKLAKLFMTVVEQSVNDEIHVSAAIGIAIFNPEEDNNVEDVFKRADIEMYQMKKKMKENK